MISRREFLYGAAASVSALGTASFDSSLLYPHKPPDRTADLLRTAPRARFWTSTGAAGADCRACHEPLPDPKRGDWHQGRPAIVKCLLCAQTCALNPGERGRCRARMNVNGELRSLVYGRPVTTHIDPIEKKPFYHFLPGSTAFSLATAGCPLRCKFCQNWQISQAKPEDFDVPFRTPAEIVSSAASNRAPVIAFTYNEPTVFTEYLTDIARIGRPQRLRHVMISCGFMKEDPLTEMCDVLDAIKIDLKGFDEDFYRKVASADLRPVLRSIKQIAKRGVHLEIVNLVVPTLNDSERMMKGLIEWVAGEIGGDVPVHFTRFHPDFQLQNLPPTPVSTLERAYELARQGGLRYAYVGNVPGHPGNHTYCPGCGKIVIRRNAFFIGEMNVRNGTCAYCRTGIRGVWS